MVELSLPDPDATIALGRRLAGLLRAGDCIALSGPLGAGKTTLVRGLLAARFGRPVDTPSPTFTLVQTYGPDLRGEELRHFDLYRLTRPDEVWELGWEDLDEGIALVEWPDRAGGLLPADRLDLELAAAADGRVARLRGGPSGDWEARLHGL